MNLRRAAAALVRIIVPALVAGLFWIGFLALFIPAFKTGNTPLVAVGWLSAPLFTGAGFAVGCMIGERLTNVRRSRFSQVLARCFAACALGAGAVFWSGPMLIVFGMFLAGTAGVVVREVVPGSGAPPAD
jgi:hypothetical protein